MISLCNVRDYAPVAQWIEQRIPVPRAGGSNPLGCAHIAYETDAGRKVFCVRMGILVECIFCLLIAYKDNNRCERDHGIYKWLRTGSEIYLKDITDIS